MGNPLLETWESQPFALPPFGKIQTSHFRPALEQGMVEHLAELQAIVDHPDDPPLTRSLARTIAQERPSARFAVSLAICSVPQHGRVATRAEGNAHPSQSASIQNVHIARTIR
jgi:Zn-dependent oligopeptidase